MKTRLVENGNLTARVRLLLIIVGVACAAVAITFEVSPIAARVLILVGFSIALVGGMASRAALLKIKPFDNSYKKARASYKTKDDKQDEPK